MAILEIGALVNLSILTCTIIDRSVRVQCMSIQINPVVYNYIYTLSSSIFLHLIDYPSFQTEQNTRCCLNNFGRHACSIYILNHTVGFSGSFIFHRIDCWHHMRSLWHDNIFKKGQKKWVLGLVWKLKSSLGLEEKVSSFFHPAPSNPGGYLSF